MSEVKTSTAVFMVDGPSAVPSGDPLDSPSSGPPNRSAPDTPVKDSSKDGCHSRSNKSQSSKFLSVQVEVDFIQMVLFIVAVGTRLWRLHHPSAIVFDELHYGRFAGMYLRRMFFFDSHPPLGKMLLAAAGYVAGWDGEFNFDHIGTFYLPSVPVWGLRFLPAMFSSLSVPVLYQVIVQMGLSQWTGLIAGTMLICDNAFVGQSRFIFIDGFLMFFMAASLLCLINFDRANKSAAFSREWWIWLCLLGLSTTCALLTKYIGLMTYFLCVAMVTRGFWRLIPDKTIPNRVVLRHFLGRVAFLVVMPIMLYVSVFYVHLSVLNKAGPHDDVMTSAFQASLEGGLAAITKGQPLHVVYGSQVTLRHTYGKPCWLHSHQHVYPIRYDDGRGSSHQQQVTCYTYKDINNWWIVKHPQRNMLRVDEPVQPVKHGDIVQIIHGITSRALNSHDVAAPASPQYQEVTCYIDYNISSPAQNLWKVDIVNRDEEGDVWTTIKSHVRLIHINTTQVLKTSGAQLAEWGFFQYEVVTDRLTNQEAAVWNVEEHRYTRSDSQEDTEKELAQAEMIPLKPTQLGFFTKFWELQVKMLQSLWESVPEHRYSSDPLSWPLLHTNVAYWVDGKTGCQIHLVGNPVLWLSGIAAFLVYSTILVFYLLRRRRNCYDLDQDSWDRFVMTGEILGVGYVLHYVPFFLTDQLLFLHHYLPALLYLFLLHAALIEHLYYIITSPIWCQIYTMCVIVWLTCVISVFRTFLPLTYGSPCLNGEQMEELEWNDVWDFIKIS